MRRAVVAAVTLLVLAGCQDGGSPSPTASTVPPVAAAGASCPGMATGVGGRAVRFGPAAGLAGVMAGGMAGGMAGSGATGIVLSHMSPGDVCQWILSFQELVGLGYRVLAYDSHGSGASAPSDAGFESDVVAAAQFLRGEGATSIVLMGASLGGASSVVAATLVEPPVAAVVSVSAPRGRLPRRPRAGLIPRAGEAGSPRAGKRADAVRPILGS